jgi:hypothetical protein
MNIELLQRISELEAIKLEISALNSQKLETENLILALVDNDKLEGGKTLKDENVSVTVTNAVTRTCDFEKLHMLGKELPPDLQLICMKQSLDLKNLRVVEKTAGERFKAALGEAITVKPRKSSVTFKRLQS